MAGQYLEQFVARIMAQAVVDPLEMVNVEEQDGKHATFMGFLDELLGEDLIETASVDQAGQGIVVRDLLQGNACLVELAEQRVHPLQVMILFLQFLVRQGRADAAANDEQRHDCDSHPQLQVVVFPWLRQGGAAG